MRVILDTNTLISALITTHSPPDKIYQAWRQGLFDLITSEYQLEEFRRASRYPKLKKLFAPFEAGEMINGLYRFATVLTDLPPVDISPDQNDNFLLSMAKLSHADYLVTGDKKHILFLGKFEATPILTATDFLKLLR